MAFTGSDWGRGVQLTGLVPASPLNGFVALVSLDNIPVEAIDAGVLSALNGGGDLRFSTDDQGANQLPLEVVSFVTSAISGNRQCQLWIRFPTYSTAARSVYMFYSRAGQTQPAVGAEFGRNAVWSDFASVLHLNELGVNGVSQNYVDSSGNGRGATAVSAPTQTQVGHPFGGYWQDFNGSTDQLVIDNTGSLLNSTNFTISVWCHNDGTTNTFDEALSSNRLTESAVNTYLMSEDNGGIAAHVGATYLKGSPALVGTLMRRVLTNNQTNWFSRINGLASVSNSSGVINTTTDIIIGRYLDTNINRFWDGDIGEHWVRLFVISDDLDVSEYANQNSPATYWTTGVPFTPTGGGESITFDSGTYALTGTEVTTRITTPITSGGYALTGTAVNFGIGAPIDSGSYALTGTDVTFIISGAGESIGLDSGTFTLTGTPVTTHITTTIMPGAYALTGTAVSIRISTPILPGAYGLTGTPFLTGINAPISSGNYALTGSAVQLRYSGDTIQVITSVSLKYLEAPTLTYLDNGTTLKYLEQ